MVLDVGVEMSGIGFSFMHDYPMDEVWIVFEFRIDTTKLLIYFLDLLLLALNVLFYLTLKLI